MYTEKSLRLPLRAMVNGDNEARDKRRIIQDAEWRGGGGGGG